MNLTEIYHRLPYGIRSLVASANGIRLHHMRYGADTRRLVEEAKSKEYWPQSRWQEWQKTTLSNMLRAASLEVPHYREFWGKYAGTEVCEDIERWPILEKDVVRSNPRRLVSDKVISRRLHCTFTSGSTGTPIQVYWSSETARRWYALFERRWRNWSGVDRNDRWALIGGKRVVHPGAKQPPFWVHNRGMKQLYLSAYHISPGTVHDYVEAICHFKARYIYAYTSAVYALAQLILDNEIVVPKLEVIITNAEPLFSYQRSLIERAFGCPVRETYGMAEMVAGASECEHGRLHLWPDAGWLEVIDSNGVIGTHGRGHLLGTSLLNPDMPLIRYRIGDTVSIENHSVNCLCGRTLPVLGAVEGRNDDLLLTRDGRRIGRLDPIFKSALPIREAQIVQTAVNHCVLNIVPAPGFDDSVSAGLAAELREVMGDISVSVKLLDEIPRSPNGKLKAVVCELHPEDMRFT